jgi:hypothetical protein
MAAAEAAPEGAWRGGVGAARRLVEGGPTAAALATEQRARTGAAVLYAQEDVAVSVGCPGEAAAGAQDETTSKVGGAPAVGGYGALPPQLCTHCGNAMVLACQVYAPVDEVHHRTLYLWACNSLPCHRHTSWCVLRRQRSAAEPEGAWAAGADTGKAKASEKKPRKKEKLLDFGAGDDWGDGEPAVGVGSTQAAMAALSMDDLESMLKARDAGANKASRRKGGAAATAPAGAGAGGAPTAAAAASPAVAVAPTPASAATAAAFPAPATPVVSPVTPAAIEGKLGGVMLDVFFEPEAVADSGDSHVQELLRRYNAEQREQGECEMAFTCAGAGDEEDGDGGTGGASGGEDDAADEGDDEGDTVAAEFRARLEREPTQCLRYGYGGVPLWPSAAQAKNGAQLMQAVPRCEACDAPRAFELQLVPGLLWYLGQALEEQVNLDFSSVLVFSCTESCPRGSAEFAVALPPL